MHFFRQRSCCVKNDFCFFHTVTYNILWAIVTYLQSVNLEEHDTVVLSVVMVLIMEHGFTSIFRCSGILRFRWRRNTKCSFLLIWRNEKTTRHRCICSGSFPLMDSWRISYNTLKNRLKNLQRSWNIREMSDIYAVFLAAKPGLHFCIKEVDFKNTIQYLDLS